MLLLILLFLNPAEGFNYEAGYDHHYTYSSTSDTLGMHNVTTVLKFRIQKINESDTGIKFHQLFVKSFVQHAQNGECYLDHKYEGKKTDTGYTLTREHTSSKTVLRTHTKVMHIDHSDNIKEIKAFDNITMNGDAPASQRTLGTPLPVDRDIKVYSSGDFPGISATAETRVHLTLKRRVDPSDSVSDGLVRDSIVVIKMHPIEHIVSGTLREVGKLDKESFLQLSHSALNKSCDISDIKCLEERYLMIDVISQMRSNASQQILVDYVLERNASVEEVRRCLIHSIATKQPIPSLVQAVEHLCLGKNHSFHGNNNMTLTQKRACLTLGALAKNLKDINNDTEAQRIIEKFETWLGIHNEGTDEITSAAHLIRSTLFDSEDVVRHSAYEIYVEHPESKQLTKEQEDAVLAVRRGTLADILKALSFHLGMPKFDWSKTVGSKKLGASFGFREENFVDLHLGMVHIDSPAIEKPFKGKFELKVDNLAFAEVNVGLIGMKFDIFRVSLCYKKKVQYNLNILKSIADVMTVTLPFVAHEMGEGFILIKDSWKFWKILSNHLMALKWHFSTNACPNEPYCSYCNINGHSRRDCESFKQDQENQGYSKHGPEIIEGRQETKLDAHSDTHSVCDNDTFSESGKNDTTDTLNVLIGASNCTRLGETDENLLNASKSGANFENFTQILDIAVQKTDSFKVDKVAICLGTNDISKHKDDSDQINLLVTKAVAQVKSAYPESHVGLCSIIPRKGNSAQINRLNQSATSVNKFIRKLCACEDNVDYVDLEKLFFKNGTIIRSLFDKADNSGVHISTEGAQNINRKLDDFFHSPKPCVQEIHTPMDPKRKRSDGTTTPTSADRMSKRSNTEPKKA
ncbi:unnamed protein product [Mytilus edulis]|uniref:Uncharacterized protein n=1 Tax=Mytilus edulis TaxID=6550 RepID=A0A8S3R7C4_MYTED|nr:unnamed protein product [Mytilus edulis]